MPSHEKKHEIITHTKTTKCELASLKQHILLNVFAHINLFPTSTKCRQIESPHRLTKSPHHQITVSPYHQITNFFCNTNFLFKNWCYKKKSYLCLLVGDEATFVALLKRESGANPEQSRCCKFLCVLNNTMPLTLIGLGRSLKRNKSEDLPLRCEKK